MAAEASVVEPTADGISCDGADGDKPANMIGEKKKKSVDDVNTVEEESASQPKETGESSENVEADPKEATGGNKDDGGPATTDTGKKKGDDGVHPDQTTATVDEVKTKEHEEAKAAAAVLEVVVKEEAETDKALFSTGEPKIEAFEKEPAATAEEEEKSSAVAAESPGEAVGEQPLPGEAEQSPVIRESDQDGREPASAAPAVGDVGGADGNTGHQAASTLQTPSITAGEREKEAEAVEVATEGVGEPGEAEGAGKGPVEEHEEEKANVTAEPTAAAAAKETTDATGAAGVADDEVSPAGAVEKTGITQRVLETDDDAAAAAAPAQKAESSAKPKTLISKLKHSVVKVIKKAITGKSSSSKPASAESN